MNNIQTTFSFNSLEEKFRLGLLSDLHFGASSMCKSVLKYDFERMANADCRIAINGDVFDFILPSDLKRFDLDALDRELLVAGLKPIDAAIDMAYEFMKPYAHLIEFIGIGNHEAHVSKRHHIDVMSILLYRLNQLPNVNIKAGGWCGFWNISLRRQGQRTSYTLYRHHGAGGAAPVTKGMIDFQRMMVWLGDLDAIWIGHKHNKFADLATKMHYSPEKNESKTKKVDCIMTGSYLSTYGTDKGTKPSYAMAWNLAPQQMGGVIVELSQRLTQEDYKRKLFTESRIIL